MSCEHWNETWVAYLYDECTPDERATIERHLADCESCRAEMDSLSATRRHLADAPSEVAMPARVVILPSAPRPATRAWSFAGGFAAAAAVFAVGIFVGVTFFAPRPIELVNQDGIDLTDPVETALQEPTQDPMYQQIRNDYLQLDDRIGRIETRLPQGQGGQLPTLATVDRLQTAVGDLNQQFDVRRTQDLQFFVEWILANDQESRIRDARTLQALLVNHDGDNNVRQH